MTCSQRSRVSPPASTWFRSLSFTILTGTFCRAWTSVPAMCSLWREVFMLDFTRPFASSRGPLVAPSPPSHIQPESPRRWPEWAGVIVPRVSTTTLLGPLVARGAPSLPTRRCIAGHSAAGWARPWSRRRNPNLQSAPPQSQLHQRLLQDGSGLPGRHLQAIWPTWLPVGLPCDVRPGGGHRRPGVDGYTALLSSVLLDNMLIVKRGIEGDYTGVPLFTRALTPFASHGHRFHQFSADSLCSGDRRYHTAKHTSHPFLLPSAGGCRFSVGAVVASRSLAGRPVVAFADSSFKAWLTCHCPWGDAASLLCLSLRKRMHGRLPSG
jgi:hypothetical protein